MARKAKPAKRAQLMEALAFRRKQLEESAAPLDKFPLSELRLPDDAHAGAFQRWSRALRDVVAYRLSTPEWMVNDDEGGHLRWRWDGFTRLFCFCYCGTARLQRSGSVEPYDVKLVARVPRIQFQVNMHLDPALPLGEEMNRLLKDAAFYRSAGQLLESSAAQIEEM